jgi:16S rRNA (adenine1518-N6/adenine1519-N6)-dimethyltransferase
MQKKFGQNFLINPATRQSLVEALFPNSDTENSDTDSSEVWEIGPGLGAMTTLLLERGLKVQAFEIDKGFSRFLKQQFAADKNFTLIEGDVMKTWPSSVLSFTNCDFTNRKGQDTKCPAPFLLGNLPYNIAAALIADLIEKGRLFKRMVVTVQKEVALRMAAGAGSSDYSSFSVMCASVYKVKPLMTIRPSSFFPKPNVDSMGVLLEIRNDEPRPEYPQNFYPLVRSLFASRRKTIKNNLCSYISGRRGTSMQVTSVNDICFQILGEAGLSGMERAEELPLETFLSIAKSAEKCDHK